VVGSTSTLDVDKLAGDVVRVRRDTRRGDCLTGPSDVAPCIIIVEEKRAVAVRGAGQTMQRVVGVRDDDARSKGGRSLERFGIEAAFERCSRVLAQAIESSAQAALTHTAIVPHDQRQIIDKGEIGQVLDGLDAVAGGVQRVSVGGQRPARVARGQPGQAVGVIIAERGHNAVGQKWQ